MALIFSLSAECGRHKQKADAVAQHFDGLKLHLADGSVYQCTADVSLIDDARWCVCSPCGVTRAGVTSEEDARLLTSIGFALYDRLRSAPRYRFALVGVEVDGCLKCNEIDNNVVELDFSGLVLSDAIWQRIGAPGVFEPFAPGYHWRPLVEVR